MIRSVKWFNNVIRSKAFDGRRKIMKKIRKVLSFLIVVCLMASLAACGGGGQSEKAALSMADEIQKYMEAVDEGFAYEVAETLAYDEELVSEAHHWRTAGSEEEHKAADYLAGVMNEIGLTEVEKIPVNLDKWQFNDASLTIEGTEIDIMPASYASDGTDADGITAEIVDVGTGTAAEYAEVDVEGKIALVGVDQWNEAWIDQYLNEAGLHGAAALVTYDVGGYATLNDDLINMHDICTFDDIMPCVSISKNQYNEIAAAIEAGNSTATLVVDNIVEENNGVSYNVAGKIKGKSSEQQIIISGHYDKYFYGFQDDCCAVGLFMAMAKAMVDSGYQPENDIIFLAHGAEEWGTVGSQFDWATGSWEVINNARPEWAEKTIALINFELPAYYDGMEEHQISCVPEFSSLVSRLVEESGIIAEPVNGVFPGGVSSVSEDTGSWDDGVSYRFAGVPGFINVGGSQEGEEGWRQQRYHTAADDKDTYNADVMMTNLNTFGAIAIYMDQTPAVELDFNATCDNLEAILDEEISDAAGADKEAYAAAIENLRAAADSLNEKIADINGRYEEAVASGADESEIEAIRAEGREMNKLTRKAFKFAQDSFVNVILTTDIGTGHEWYLNNITVISDVIAALEAGELYNDDETGALDIAWAIDGENEYGYYLFSPETTEAVVSTLLEESNPGNLFWGTGKGHELAGTAEATISLLEKSESEDENMAFDEEIAIYKSAMERQMQLMKECMDAEAAAMNELAEMIA